MQVRKYKTGDYLISLTKIPVVCKILTVTYESYIVTDSIGKWYGEFTHGYFENANHWKLKEY